MSSDNRASEEPLLGEEASKKEKCQHYAKRAGIALLGVSAVLFVLAWMLQGLIYWAVTTASGCSPSALKDYPYPGGDSSAAGDGKFNIMPRITLLVERAPSFFGEAYDVIPTNEASAVSGAPHGTWWRTWGPYFYTWTYEDTANSRTVLYMRENLLKLGGSHRIARCDEKGPYVIFEEGLGYFKNRARKMLHMNQAYTFNVYADDKLKMLFQETGQTSGFPSMQFRNVTTNLDQGSSVLQATDFHGSYDEWLVNNPKDIMLPYWVTSAATALYADALGHLAAKDPSVTFLGLPFSPENATNEVLDTNAAPSEPKLEERV